MMHLWLYYCINYIIITVVLVMMKNVQVTVANVHVIVSSLFSVLILT